jgi:hypothetical protein
MKNGCVLCGGVGSGKSRTALAYYYLQNEGSPDSLMGGDYVPMGDPPKDLYIITTPHKRDTQEWVSDMVPFLISTNPDVTPYRHNVVIDSWNNIKKYSKVYGAFFIFDEQRVVGKGTWVKAFLDIARKNQWILLSATPGDTWSDYIPVFIANGFYKNRTQFNDRHVIWSRFSKFPKIDRYIDTGILLKQRSDILIDMDFMRHTTQHHEEVYVSYDVSMYKNIMKTRWNPYTDQPIATASEFCSLLRRVVNSDQSRQMALLQIVEKHPRVIIFYNYNYELNILRNLYYGEGVKIAEWNGHAHQDIPKSDRWVYLVQYTAGAEGWNCVITDTVVFYSQNYSYKVMVQSAGRIDRLNTLFSDLYYYHLKSRSGIDLAIGRALSGKKRFNESAFTKGKY